MWIGSYGGGSALVELIRLESWASSSFCVCVYHAGYHVSLAPNVWPKFGQLDLLTQFWSHALCKICVWCLGELMRQHKTLNHVWCYPHSRHEMSICLNRVEMNYISEPLLPPWLGLGWLPTAIPYQTFTAIVCCQLRAGFSHTPAYGPYQKCYSSCLCVCLPFVEPDFKHIVIQGPKPTVLYSNYKFIGKLYLPLPKDKTWPAELFKRWGGGQIRTNTDYRDNIVRRSVNQQKHSSQLIRGRQNPWVPWHRTSTIRNKHFARTLDKAGRLRTSGSTDLKESQHYPDNFGLAVAKLYMQHKASDLEILPEMSTVYFYG